MLKFVNFDEIANFSNRLCRNIIGSGYHVEHVLYVERAGLFIGWNIARFFDCPISPIFTKRRFSHQKELLRFLLIKVPNPILRILRVIEVKSKIHSIISDRNVKFDHNHSLNTKNVLVVDDAVDTGNTLFSVKTEIEQRSIGYKDIRYAVITITQNNTIFLPDYYLFKDLMIGFPWSMDSSLYNQSKEYYFMIKNAITKQ